MATWHYIAQRVITGEFLDLDIPLDRDELSWDLSGPGALRGTISPDVGRLRAPDGRLLLEEWGTLLYAEADGEIRWGGIVVSSRLQDEAWTVEAAGFSTYPHGIPYDRVFSRIGVDPADCFREVWSAVQAYPDGNIRVLVPGDTTPVRLGLDAYVELADGTSRPTAGYDKNNLPEGVQWHDADPYELQPFDRKDCGDELDSLAKTTPFDYVERHFWVPEEPVEEDDLDGDLVIWLYQNGWTKGPDGRLTAPYLPPGGITAGDISDEDWTRLKTAGWWDDPNDGVERIYPPRGYGHIAHVIRIGYPRRGRRRDDLAFVQGSNIIDVVTVDVDGDNYANTVIGVGAGEGAAGISITTAVRDGRLRRASVYTDKTVTDQARLLALVNAELAARRNALEIREVTVRNHANAPLGSWQLGDDVLIEADVPWLGEVSLWCRVTGWSLVSEDTARLALTRSDSFRYGG